LKSITTKLLNINPSKEIPTSGRNDTRCCERRREKERHS